MQILPSDQLRKYINPILHADTQLHETHLDLTVKAINHPVRVGALDFGGSEFEAAGMETQRAFKQHNDDSYAWWNLQPGLYQAEFNEEISQSGNDLLAFISLHEHAIEAGLSSGSCMTKYGNGSLKLNFQVPNCGCNIKENARLATLRLWRED